MLDSGRFISDVIVAYGNSRGNPEKVLPKISGMLIAKEVRGRPVSLVSVSGLIGVCPQFTLPYPILLFPSDL